MTYTEIRMLHGDIDGQEVLKLVDRMEALERVIDEIVKLIHGGTA